MEERSRQVADPGPASHAARGRLAGLAPEALLLYLPLSLIFFGRALAGHLSDRYIGAGHDPGVFPFYLEWWRYALANHLNPFNLNVVWAPSGFNLAITTNVPLAAFALMPIEIWLGPIAAYNIATLLCPALAAWTAFLMCRRIANEYWPALAGGYIFGFSPYMLGRILGHLSLAMVFLLPVAVLITLLWIDRELSNRRYAALMSIVMIGQFLSSPEVLATASLFGGGAILLAYLLDFNRARLLQMPPPLGIAFAVTVIAMSPYIYRLFGAGPLQQAARWTTIVSASPIELLIPTATNVFGHWKVAASLASGFDIWEAGDYIGVPLILMMWSFARGKARGGRTRYLTILFACPCLATLGPYLRMFDRALVPLPWWIATHLPILDLMLPARLAVYMFMVLAIVASIALGDSSVPRAARILAGLVIVLFLLPNCSAAFWTIANDAPDFFSGGGYKHYIEPGENVVILPYGLTGDSEVWQADARMYFRMAGGYTSVLPPAPKAFTQYPILASLYNLAILPDADEQLKAFLADKQVGAIVVADDGEHLWQAVPRVRPMTLRRVALTAGDRAAIAVLMSGLGVAPIKVGGVRLYQVPLERLKPYAAIDPARLQERAAQIRMATLMTAARRYLKRGLDPAALNSLKAQGLGLLPPLWVNGPYVDERPPAWTTQNGLILGPSANDNVDVGVFGSHDALAHLAAQYGPLAVKVVTLPPDLHSANQVESTEWVLILQMSPAGLARAAPIAATAIAADSAPLVH